MALIKCEECGETISDKAEICINCGAPINNKNNTKSWYDLESDEQKELLKEFIDKTGEKKSSNGEGAVLFFCGLIIGSFFGFGAYILTLSDKYGYKFLVPFLIGGIVITEIIISIDVNNKDKHYEEHFRSWLRNSKNIQK